VKLLRAAVWLFAFLFLGLSTFCLCQVPSPSVLCRGGDGTFDATFRNKITVHVGAARESGAVTLAKRACAAKLRWENQELVVESNAAQIDLDAFGIDLGDGIPVAAFQIRKFEDDCCMEYRIFAIDKNPRLLRTISGGKYFSASDVDLDGRVEIWTDDAAAISGFESLALGELDAPPRIVFRFAHGQLIDVSAEFQPYYDRAIAALRDRLPAGDLQEFKNSDGQLKESLTPNSAERLHRLRQTKIRTLEIVWDYLYSGREADAHLHLSELWPSADVDRIWTAIMNARAAGIHSQANATSTGPSGKKKKTPIFDAVRRNAGLDSVPTGILLEFQTVPEQQLSLPAELRLDLIIDAAGKVRSASPQSGVSPTAVAVTSTWKFIPAFKDGRPVACHSRMSVWPKQ